MIANNNLLKVQSFIILIGIILMGLKFWAYFQTHSNAILSDALESIINVAAGSFALYSLWLSGKPKDHNHPYGHGKIEFISAGFEGGMIVLAAIYILFESIQAFFHPMAVKQLDLGILLVGFSGLINLVMGLYLVQTGKKTRGMAMVADGKHLISDFYTSSGLILGLVLVKITGFIWLDAVLAIAMGIIILFTGFQLVRKALSGLMDETDLAIVSEILPVLNQHRKDEWIDIHNLRIVKYGSDFHIDAHVTLPWYWSLERAHQEVTAIDYAMASNFHSSIELFIHADPCLPLSCGICPIENCIERQHQFEGRILWSMPNILANQKHSTKLLLEPSH